jgi:hypothetical protein
VEIRIKVKGGIKGKVKITGGIECKVKVKVKV